MIRLGRSSLRIGGARKGEAGGLVRRWVEPWWEDGVKPIESSVRDWRGGGVWGWELNENCEEGDGGVWGRKVEENDEEVGVLEP